MAVTNKNLIIKAKREAKEKKAFDVTDTLVINKKDSFDEQRVKDNEIVRGRFNYNEVPGGTLKFSFKKYKGDPVVSYTLIDSQVYELPRMVAKHLATSGSYPVHEHQMDESGKVIIKIGHKKRRYSFESLAFLDDKDVTSANSNLYTASSSF